ncbi:unnamed protein product [Ectocarpus sp. 4 AP-2014]
MVSQNTAAVQLFRLLRACSNEGRPELVDHLIQELPPSRPRLLLHIAQRAAASLVCHQEHVQVADDVFVVVVVVVVAVVVVASHAVASGAGALATAGGGACTADCGCITAAAAAAAAALAAPVVGLPLLFQKHADDVEAGLRRPADLVQREAAQVVACRQGAAVGHQEQKKRQVAAAAGDVHDGLAELVASILFS